MFKFASIDHINRKIDVNIKICKYFESNSKKDIKNAQCFLLDCPSGTSISTFKKLGFEDKNLFVPQYNKKEYEIMIKQHPECHIINQHSEDALEIAKEPYDLVYHDGMQSYKFQKYALRKFFDRKLLKDNSIFAYTLCFRGGVGLSSRHKTGMKMVAKKNGYNIKFLEDIKSNRCIKTFIYEVTMTK